MINASKYALKEAIKGNSGKGVIIIRKTSSPYEYEFSLEKLSIMANEVQFLPLKYINKLKLYYAKELLRSGYYTVSQVSEKCGFENIQYFSLFIKKETGKTPSQFLL